MSTTIDNRVVKMTFDNAQFEKAIEATLGTLSKFEKALSFENASHGFEGLTKAAGKVDLSNLSQSVIAEAGKIDTISAEAAASIGRIDDAAQNADFSPIANSAITSMNEANEAIAGLDISSIYTETQTAGEGFNAMSAIAVGALMEIGSGIENYVVSKLKGLMNSISSVTIDPIKEGFGEYETQVGAIQTIIANTGRDFDSAEDIKEVNDVLDELNLYADRTIYKFTDMVDAIGRFTASGLELKESAEAVQGLANVAALSGATMSDVSRVLPQAAQALSSGTVSMQDWFSFESANMNSKIFVNQIADLAMHMAEVGKAEESAYEAGRRILEEGMTMRTALNKVDSKDISGWFSSDILANALKLFSMDIRSMTTDEIEETKNYFRTLGYTTEEEFTKLFDQAQMANRAATEVRTFSQMLDTVGESIGSNWTGVWRNLIGDFKQATDTFTFLSNTLSGGIDALFNGIVESARVFNSSGAIDIMFGSFIREFDESTGKMMSTGERAKGALDYIVEAVSKPLGAIKEAFDNVFGMDTAQLEAFWVGIATGLKDFASSLVISDNAAEGLKNIFEGVFSVVKLGMQAISDAGVIFGKVIDTVRAILDPVVDIVLALGGQVGKFVTWIVERILDFREIVIALLTPVEQARQGIVGIVQGFFEWVDLPGKINLVGDCLIAVLDTIWNIVTAPQIFEAIGQGIGGIVKTIADITGWTKAVEDARAASEKTGEQVSALDIWIQNLLKNPVVDFFAKIVGALAQPIIKIYEFAKGFAEMDENTRKAQIAETFEKIKAKVDIIAAPLNVLIDALKNFFGALGEFGVKVFDYITHLQPIVDLGNSIQTFFTELPNKLSNIGGVITGVIGTHITNPIDAVVKWFNDTAQYFRTVSIEQFIEDAKNSIINFYNGIKDFIIFMTTLTPDTILLQWLSFVDGFKNGNSELYTSILTIAESIDSEFGLNGTIPAILNSLAGLFGEAIDGISSILVPALAKSKSIPEIFINIFKEIWNRLIVFIDDTKEAILNFKPYDLFVAWTGIKDKIVDFVDSVLPSLSEAAKDAVDSITKFFVEVTSGGATWEQTFGRILEKVNDKLGGIPKTVLNVLDIVRKGVATGLSAIAGMLSNLPGGIGDFFGGLKDTFAGFGFVDEVPDVALSAIGKMGETLDSIETPSFDGLTKFNLFDTVKQWVDEQINKLPDVVKDIPEKIGTFFSALKEAFNKDTIDGIMAVINGLTIRKVFLSVTNVINGIGGVVNSYSRVLLAKAQEIKDTRIDRIGTLFLKIAGSMVVISAAIYAISTIEDPQKAVIILGELGVLAVAIEGLSGLLNKVLGGNAGVNVLAAAASLGVLAADMVIATKAIEALAVFDWKKNEAGIWAGVGMLGVFGLFVIAITKFGGSGGSTAIQAAASILGIVGALYALIPAFESLNEFIEGKLTGTLKDGTLNDQLVKLGATLVVMVGSMAGVAASLRLAGEHGFSAGLGFLLASQGIGAIANALEKLTELSFWDLLGSAAILAGLLAEFAVIADRLGALDLLATGASIIVFGDGLKVIGEAITNLANIEGAGSATIYLAGLVVVLGAITEWTSGTDLLASSAAMVIFGAALIEMSLGLSALAQVDSDSIGYAAIALDSLIAVLGLITTWSSGIDLLATSAGMIAFGAAVIEMSMGLSELATLDAEALSYAAIALDSLIAVLGLITAWTSGIDLLATSAGMVAFGLAIIEMSGGLTILSQVDSEALNNSTLALSALLAVFWGIAQTTSGLDLVATAASLDLFAVALVGIASAILIFAEALNAMPDGEKIHDVGYNILTGIGEGLVDGAKAILTGLGDIVMMIVDGFKNLFGIHSPSTLMSEEIGQYLPAGIAEGITGGTGDITGALSGVGDNILGWVQTDGLNVLGDAGSKFTDWIGTDGLQLLSDAGDKFTGWLGTDGVELFGKFLTWAKEKGGELSGKFIAWMESDGIPMLEKAGGDIWNWITTDGVDLFGKFLGWLGEKALELAGKFGAWMESDGIPMLEKAGGDIWNWISTDGAELFGKFLEWLGEQAVEIGSKIGAWFINDALPWLGEKLEDLKNAVIDWFLGIPDWLMDTLGGINFGEIGDFIVQGIAEGITGGITWITNAIGGLGQSALDGIKDFFGIESPSTVMRDEVGINIDKGIAEGIIAGLNSIYDTSHELFTKMHRLFADEFNDEDWVDEVGHAVVDAKDAITGDRNINELLQTVGAYFPKQISDAIVNSKQFKEAQNGNGEMFEAVRNTVAQLANAGYTLIDEESAKTTGKIDNALSMLGDFMDAQIPKQLQFNTTKVREQNKEVLDAYFEDQRQYAENKTLDTVDSYVASTQTTIQNASDSTVSSIGTTMQGAADDIEAYSINIAQGLTTGIDERGHILFDELAVNMRDYIKGEFAEVMKDEDAKKFAKEKLSAIEKAIRGDNTLNDLVQTIGEYFPKEIAETLLKSPGLYIKNPSAGYIEWMKGIIYEIAQSGYGIVDSTVLEAEGKLDGALNLLQQYMNGSTAEWLDEYNQYLTNDFEVKARAMANGMYEAGASIPQAFIDGIGDIVNNVRPNSLYANIWADVNDVIGDMGASKSNYASYTDSRNLVDSLNTVEEVMKAAAERLPTVFTQEFQKHTDLSVPQLKDSLNRLLQSAIPNLTGDQAEYLNSIVSAGDIINATFDEQYMVWRNGIDGTITTMRDRISTLDELAAELGRVLPEGIYNGIMEHSNLPLEAVENIGFSMKEAVNGAVTGDSTYYLERLTAAYSSLVDSFYYEIDNAKDVEELGEIIGRYFPEGMGTGIVDNRDVPMEEMISNLKWMAANGQLEIPGFNQTGEQLGLAVSDGVVKGLFADFGATGPEYITDYANQVKAQTGPFNDAGSEVGYALAESMGQQLTGNEGLVSVVDGSLTEVGGQSLGAATTAGTNVGEAVTTGAETGLSGVNEAISDSVSDSNGEAKEAAANTGKQLGSAIVEAMNTELDNEEHGLVKTLEQAAEKVKTKAETVGKAIAEAVKTGIGDGFKDEKSTKRMFDQVEAFFTGQLTGYTGKDTPSVFLSNDDLGKLTNHQYDVKMVNINDDSKKILTDLLKTRLDEAIANNKTNMDAAAKNIHEQNKTNITSVLTDLKYADTLSTIDNDINSVKTTINNNHEALIKKLATIETAQTDMYNLIKNNTNDYLRGIETNTGRNFDIYMDTGALVGSISDEMDQALGYRQMLSSRGSS